MHANELDTDRLARRFEEHRTHLRAVAYRMLGSVTEADDAVQEAWLRLSRSASDEIENLGGWLTTVVGRICLDMLRSRKTRGEDFFGPHVPDPIVSREDTVDPEHEALLTDSVGLALMVVLETLNPAERVAYVLHDMFSVPFEEIAPLSSASRRRRASWRVALAAACPTPRSSPTSTSAGSARWSTRSSPPRARVTSRRSCRCSIRTSCSTPTAACCVRSANAEVQGAREVASRAQTYARLSPYVRPARVNGVAGVVVAPKGKPFAVIAFTVRGGKSSGSTPSPTRTASPSSTSQPPGTERPSARRWRQAAEIASITSPVFSSSRFRAMSAIETIPTRSWPSITGRRRIWCSFIACQRLLDRVVGADRHRLALAELAGLDLIRVPALGEHVDDDVAVGQHALQAIVLAADRHGADAQLLEFLRRIGDRLVLSDALRVRGHHVSCLLAHLVLLVDVVPIRLPVSGRGERSEGGFAPSGRANLHDPAGVAQLVRAAES